MRNVKFLKEPGYVFDLLFLFILYFNKDRCISRCLNYNKAKEDTEYYKVLLKRIPPISDDVLLFFHIEENRKSFMTTLYYDTFFNQKKALDTSFDLEYILVQLADHERVIGNVIRYYFPDITEEGAAACRKSMAVVDRLIKKTSYSAAVKSALYSFFISPSAVIQTLCEELRSHDLLLAHQYKKEYPTLSDLQEQVDVEALAQQLKDISQPQLDINLFKNTYISFCLNHKNLVKAHYDNDELLVLLGIDYRETFLYLTKKNTHTDLEMFGAALSERNRVDILNFMLLRGEITIRDVEQEFKLTGTNAYYHLSLMIKAGVVKTRNQGRTVLYSINKEYFGSFCQMLTKYS